MRDILILALVFLVVIFGAMFFNTINTIKEQDAKIAALEAKFVSLKNEVRAPEVAPHFDKDGFSDYISNELELVE